MGQSCGALGNGSNARSFIQCEVFMRQEKCSQHPLFGHPDIPVAGSGRDTPAEERCFIASVEFPACEANGLMPGPLGVCVVQYLRLQVFMALLLFFPLHLSLLSVFPSASATPFPSGASGLLLAPGRNVMRW